MSSKTFKYKPIYPGFPWGVTIAVASPSPVFPAGATFKAAIRVNPNSAVIATITTVDGELTRLDDGRMAIRIPGAKTAPMLEGRVMLDLIRTDTPEDEHTGIRIAAPVSLSVTPPDA